MVNGTELPHFAFWTAVTRIRLAASPQACVAWQIMSALVCTASGIRVWAMKRSILSSVACCAARDRYGGFSTTPANAPVF
eukprot:890620-Prymnesium_polylepis.3